MSKLTKSTNQDKVIVRYPPSPTGNLHIGNIRTMLFNYLFAKHAELGGDGNSDIYMRFEDTDTERSKVEYEDVALETLEALGITFDHGPYRQSERGELYNEAIAKLIEQGDAFVGEETKDGSGNVIRFKNPNKEITFTDAIRGDITIDTTDFGDFVIARSLESPLYHLTVVVDDTAMGVTHIIRGEDHITSTPRQILLIEALGGKVPNYAHLPLIIGADKKKLGKRHGAVTYQEFAQQGYLPEAIVNYLALLGWSEGNDREIYTMQELVEAFTLEGVSRSPAMFSYEKLDSVNRHYVLQMTDESFESAVMEHVTDDVKEFLSTASKEVKSVIIHTIIKERIHKWGDVESVCQSELSWLNGVGEFDIEKVVWKKSNKEETKKHLEKVVDLLSNVSESDWATATDSKSDDNAIKNAIWDYASEVGRGAVLWPMRYSLTGAERSPDPFIVAFVLGKWEVLKRLELVINKL